MEYDTEIADATLEYYTKLSKIYNRRLQELLDEREDEDMFNPYSIEACDKAYYTWLLNEEQLETVALWKAEFINDARVCRAVEQRLADVRRDLEIHRSRYPSPT